MEDLVYLFGYKKPKHLSIKKKVKFSKLEKTAAEQLDNNVTRKFYNCFSADLSKKLWTPANDIETIPLPRSFNKSKYYEIQQRIGEDNKVLENYIEFPKEKVIAIPKIPTNTQKWKKPLQVILNTHVTKQIRIYPNDKQKKYFEKLFGAHRYFYNKAVDCITDIKLDVNHLNFFNIRNTCIPTIEKLLPTELWQAEINRNVKANAVQKVIDAYSTCNTLKKKGYIKKFEIKKKHDGNQIFYFQKQNSIVKNGKIVLFPKDLKNLPLQTKSKNSKWIYNNINSISGITTISKRKETRKLLHDSNIIRDQNGKYYTSLLYNKKVETVPTGGIISLDPGVRTFQTGYSQTGCY